MENSYCTCSKGGVTPVCWLVQVCLFLSVPFRLPVFPLDWVPAQARPASPMNREVNRKLFPYFFFGRMYSSFYFGEGETPTLHGAAQRLTLAEGHASWWWEEPDVAVQSPLADRREQATPVGLGPVTMEITRATDLFAFLFDWAAEEEKAASRHCMMLSVTYFPANAWRRTLSNS